MFCKQFLSSTVPIDWCYHSIHKHSSGSQHISVFTTRTYMMTSGMHRRPFEGQHLFISVISIAISYNFFKLLSTQHIVKVF